MYLFIDTIYTKIIILSVTVHAVRYSASKKLAPNNKIFN